MCHFYTARKNPKASDFLMFSRVYIGKIGLKEVKPKQRCDIE